MPETSPQTEFTLALAGFLVVVASPVLGVILVVVNAGEIGAFYIQGAWPAFCVASVAVSVASFRYRPPSVGGARTFAVLAILGAMSQLWLRFGVLPHVFINH